MPIEKYPGDATGATIQIKHRGRGGTFQARLYVASPAQRATGAVPVLVSQLATFTLADKTVWTTTTIIIPNAAWPWMATDGRVDAAVQILDAANFIWFGQWFDYAYNQDYTGVAFQLGTSPYPAPTVLGLYPSAGLYSAFVAAFATYPFLYLLTVSQAVTWLAGNTISATLPSGLPSSILTPFVNWLNTFAPIRRPSEGEFLDALRNLANTAGYYEAV